MSDTVEKRQFPRWLCNRNFRVKVLIADQRYDMSPINFNHQGIGLFCSERLPDVSQCLLTLSYDSDTLNVSPQVIPATIVHSRETEVGSDYGLKFELSDTSDALQADLLAIEEILANSQSGEDRYGLFG